MSNGREKLKELNGNNEIKKVEGAMSDEAIQSAYGLVRPWIEGLVADIGAKKLFANQIKYSFDTKRNEKMWDKIVDFNGLQDMFFTAYQKISREGKVYITMYETSEGVGFQLADYGTHTSFNNKLFEVTTTSFLTKGNVGYRVEETTNSKTTKRTILQQNEDGVFKNIPSKDFNTIFSLLEKDQLKETIEHNYGFVPVVLIENIPTADGNGRNDLQGQNIWINVLQKLFNRLGLDIDLERPRVLIPVAEGEGGTFTDSITKGNQVITSLIKAGILITYANADTELGSTGTPNTAQVIPSNSKISEILTSINSILGIIMQAAGFAFSSQESLSTAIVQKTEFEVNLVKDSEIGAFKRKQTTWQRAIKELIKKSLYIQSKGSIDLKNGTYSAQVELLNIKNETALIENALKLFEKGIIVKEEVRQKVENITLSDSFESYKAIKRLADENVVEPIEEQEEPVVEPIEVEEPKEIKEGEE